MGMLQAQGQSMGAEGFPRNAPMAFAATQSMFYYSDIGYQTSHEAILLAANANEGGSQIYNTSDSEVFMVGYDSTVYIARSLEALQALVPGDIDTEFDYSIHINSPSNKGNANLSLFILQLEEDLSGERFMYVEGIGVSVIQDVDPSTSQGIQIENGQVFTIQTVPVESSNTCGGTGNHSLKIQW